MLLHYPRDADAGSGTCRRLSERGGWCVHAVAQTALRNLRLAAPRFGALRCMPRGFRASAIAASLLLTACGGGARSGPAGVPRAAPTASSAVTAHPAQILACGDYADTHPPPANWEVVLGVVALPAAPHVPALQTFRSGQPDPAARLFSKAGLIVRAGTDFQLVVPRSLATRLSIGCAIAAGRSSRVIVNGCHPYPGRACGICGRRSAARRPRWLAYPGGYWIPHPACISLLVKTHNRQRRVRIGLGTPCPGQQPPPAPTQT